MPSELGRFERVARRAHQFSEARERSRGFDHPFSERNIAPELPAIVQELFDNGHYAQATFEAYKFVDKEVQRHAKSSKSGMNLMMDTLGGVNPAVRLTPMLTSSQQDEQKGFQFLFAGAVLAIRNPRGHDYAVNDDPDGGFQMPDQIPLAELLSYVADQLFAAEEDARRRGRAAMQFQECELEFAVKVEAGGKGGLKLSSASE